MLGVSELVREKLGPGPSKDEVQAMLNSRAWLYLVYSCMSDGAVINSAMCNPSLSGDERTFNAGRMDATERMISKLPKTLFGKPGDAPTKEELDAEDRFRQTMKGLFNV